MNYLHISPDELRLALAHEFGHIIYTILCEVKKGSMQWSYIKDTALSRVAYSPVSAALLQREEYAADIIAILLTSFQRYSDFAYLDHAALDSLISVFEKTKKNNLFHTAQKSSSNSFESHPDYTNRIKALSKLNEIYFADSPQFYKYDQLIKLIKQCIKELEN